MLTDAAVAQFKLTNDQDWLYACVAAADLERVLAEGLQPPAQNDVAGLRWGAGVVYASWGRYFDELVRPAMTASGFDAVVKIDVEVVESWRMMPDEEVAIRLATGADWFERVADIFEVEVPADADAAWVRARPEYEATPMTRQTIEYGGIGYQGPIEPDALAPFED